MVDVTNYLNKKGLDAKETARGFLRMSKVKYIIASDEKFKVTRISGRYGGTKMSKDLFEIMKLWLGGYPISTLNRKEFEVSEYLETYFKDEIICQFKYKKYFIDWFIPKYNLAIEFYEKEHKYKESADEKRIDNISKFYNVFIIHEKTVMADLAKLSIIYRPL